VPAVPYQDAAGRWLSDDGAWFYDGSAWRPVGQAARARLSTPAKALIGAAVAVGALVALAMTVGIVATLTSRPGRTAGTDPAPNASRVQCQPVEQLANHFHTRVVVVDGGNLLTIPAYVGIRSDCIYWLHTHDDSGVIHVETPITEFSTTFTLGDFFSVWGQPIDSSRVAAATVESGQTMRVWVQEGPSAQARSWSKNPAAIPLHDCELITVVIGSGTAAAPAYDFPTAFGCGA